MHRRGASAGIGPPTNAMIDFRTTLLAAAALAASLSAQEPEPQAPAKPPAAAAPKPQADVEALVRDLGSDRFRARLDAERALRDLGEAAVPALRKAAETSDDAEVQWRARRVLRQIEAGKAGGALAPRGRTRDDAPEAGAQPQGPQRDMVRDQFDSLFERLQRDFGIDVPRARFFDDRFFQDLQEQMKAGAGRSQGMTMQVGPDGSVHVEVEERGEDGKAEKKVYDAPDMESFQKQYPGVLRRNGFSFGFPSGNGFFRSFGGQFGMDELEPMPPLGPRPRTAPARPQGEVDAAPPPAGRRLGVSVRSEVPPDVREYLELPDGVGLMVETVQDGSLAQALGLQRGDIVTRIGDDPIGSPQDVQQALGKVEQGADVAVTFLRKGAEQTKKAAKTEAPAAEAAPTPLQKRGRKADGESIR